MSSHEQDTPAADLNIRTQVQQLPEPTSSDDVNSTSPNFGTFTGPSVPGYPFLSQPQASGEIGRLGDYRVLAKLGEGGMGFVFRAEDPALKRFVALKVMRPEVAAKPLAADRFLREGRAAAGLKSDHVITIYQVGQANGAPFIAMEYLEGIALDEWMKQQKKAVPVPHVLRVVRDTLRGLATAHDKGLIHRDIKPANLWIEKGTARIKVLDFGLTRGMDGNDQMTADGAVVGTPAYMAPEQAAGKPVDPRADLFSVGTVMYQLFLGINPFVRSNMMATMGAVSFDVQPPVVTLRPEVPQAYSDYLDRLLAKDPGGRPANAKAALAELAAIEKSLQDTAKTLASSSSLPVVSMMAPAAAAMPAQVWGDLTESDDTVVRTKISDPEIPRKPPSKKLLIGSGLFAFFALILGGIVIIITNKDGTKTKVEVPDGATVDVQKDGKSVASVGGKKADVARAKVVMDADRKAAEFVLINGGILDIGDRGYRQNDLADLPIEPFKCLHVSLAARELSDAEAQMLFTLDGLKGLSFHYSLTEQNLAKLVKLPAAQSLAFMEANTAGLTDTGLKPFRNFPLLYSLRLNNLRITGSGFKDWAGWELADLRFRFQSGFDAGNVKLLKDLPKLGCLLLAGDGVTDAALPHLREFPALRELTNAGLSTLETIPNLGLLRVLIGGGPGVTGEFLKSVGRMKLLSTFVIDFPVRDADVKPLLGLAGLRELVLYNVPEFGDAGLMALADIKSLKSLSISNSLITAEGLKKFRAMRSDVQLGGTLLALGDPDRRAAEFVLGK